jgi:DNA-binding LytR/AlgR family response regulator
MDTSPTSAPNNGFFVDAVPVISGDDRKFSRVLHRSLNTPVNPQLTIRSHLLHTIETKDNVRVGLKLTGGELRLMDLSEVFSVSAQGNYVLLHEEARCHLLRKSIHQMERELRRYSFVRIHRSVLVNAALICELQLRQRGKYTLRMIDGRRYSVSRTYTANLRTLAPTWIGQINFISAGSEPDRSKE